MTTPLSPQRSAELQELVRDLGAQMRATPQVVRVELIRRGWTDAEIATAVEVSPRTVQRVRQAWVTEGFDAAVFRRPPSVTRPHRLDGEQEARLVTLACSAPPAGYQRWSLRLLAGKLIELEIVDGIAPNTVRSVLKKTPSSRG